MISHRMAIQDIICKPDAISVELYSACCQVSPNFQGCFLCLLQAAVALFCEHGRSASLRLRELSTKLLTKYWKWPDDTLCSEWWHTAYPILALLILIPFPNPVHVLQGVPKFVVLLTPHFSLAWVDISGLYFRWSKYDVLGFVWCIKLYATYPCALGKVGFIWGKLEKRQNYKETD